LEDAEQTAVLGGWQFRQQLVRRPFRWRPANPLHNVSAQRLLDTSTDLDSVRVRVLDVLGGAEPILAEAGEAAGVWLQEKIFCLHV
jgi:hypothetical protein